jgi:hypothetical protein
MAHAGTRTARRVSTSYRTSRSAVLAVFVCVAVGLVARVLTGEVSYGMATTLSVQVPADGEPSAPIVVLTVVQRSPLTLAEILSLGDPAPISRPGRPLPPSEASRRYGSSSELGRSLDDAWLVATGVADTTARHERWWLVEHTAPAWPSHAAGFRSGDHVIKLEMAPSGEVRGATVWRSGELIELTIDPPAPAEILDTLAVSSLHARLPDGRPAMLFGTRIDGPSAGLAQALSYLDSLTPGELTAGLLVGATGVLDHAGAVFSVGGVGLKARAASSAGVAVLFVPSGNLDEAAAAASPGIEVVPVDHVADVLSWLCAHRSAAACAVSPRAEALRLERASWGDQGPTP